MAQDVKTNEQQNQAEARDVARGRQQTQQPGLARRSGYDPFGLSLMPFDLFPFNPFSILRRVSGELEQAAWMPAVEVLERDGNLVVRAELAGMRPEDVKVEVDNGMLVIEGERKFEREEDRSGVQRSERRYGRFYRAIPLPDGADVEHANARFDNGVLEITIAAPKQTNNKQIPIQSSPAGQSASGSQSAPSGETKK